MTLNRTLSVSHRYGHGFRRLAIVPEPEEHAYFAPAPITRTAHQQLVLVRVGRCGSMTSAAEELKLSVAGISKSVSRLEH
jgi:hypothetical protein